MNILYISNLSGDRYSGLTYSVPNQIKAQALEDNVFWYNTKFEGNKDWKKLSFYHDLNDFPSGKIKRLPKPFNNPDLIIVEGFYSAIRNRIVLEIFLSNIPYIIIPRGELTERAQNRKKAKKSIANFMFCNFFARKALVIEYLTEQEKKDSTNKWNKNSVVIPNGIVLPKNTKKNFSINKINCSFIGRIEPYQKGLDLLIEASELIKDKMLANNVKINIYGPDEEGKLGELKKIIEKKGLVDIFDFHDSVYNEEKEKVLLETDIFIMTSRFEGHPMALIEALSIGLPVVITNGTNMKEEIEYYNAGWSAETKKESISKAIEKMINDKKEFIKKGENAKKLSNIYMWETIAKESHKIYNNLLENRRSN